MVTISTLDSRLLRFAIFGVQSEVVLLGKHHDDKRCLYSTVFESDVGRLGTDACRDTMLVTSWYVKGNHDDLHGLETFVCLTYSTTMHRIIK